MLGIGASSSAAYTLRKHYTKNLLAFECHYDRGDIDPLPIIQQVEAGTKKKSTKAASVPSPGKIQTIIIIIINSLLSIYKCVEHQASSLSIIEILLCLVLSLRV